MLGMLSRLLRKNVLVALIASTFLVLCYSLFFLDTDRIPYIYRTTKTIQIDSPWTRRIERYPVGVVKLMPTGRPMSFPRVQIKSIKESAAAKKNRITRLTTIKDAFKHSWKGYREHAWLADELKPVTGGQHASFGNWSATLVDSLDTLWIMDMREEFDEAVQAIAKIDFETSTSKTIGVFETTIRYLGGLLSAYELSGRSILLQKALELGHLLYAAFDTPSRMPVPWFDWQNALNNGPQDTMDHAISADIGSLSLEFTKLSQLSGDARFYDAIQRINDVFAAQQDNSKIPGLWPVFVDALSGNFAAGNEFSFGALSDSLYEYTSKMHILLGGLIPEYGEMYKKAIDAAKKHLFVRAMNPQNKDLLFSTVVRSDAFGSSSSDASGQHLTCFVGGMIGMGSKLYERIEDLETAIMLSDGCYWAYEAMGSGIMPETMMAVPCPSNSEQCNWDEENWKKAVLSHSNAKDKSADDLIAEKHLPAGFSWIPDGRYILRPEAIESLFYMYRITGDSSWQDKAWKMFLAIDKAAKSNYGYSAIENVAAEELKQVDSMESFWTAETLKYLYLIFSDPDLISLDEWVFNTEAHPLHRLLPKKYFW